MVDFESIEAAAGIFNDKLKSKAINKNKSEPLLNTRTFQRTLIIDVHNLAWKAYFTRAWANYRTQKGNKKSGHIFGAFAKLYAIINTHCIQPRVRSALVLVEDEYPVKQKELFPSYKEHRKKIKRPENVVPDVIELISTFPHILVSIPSKDEEADSIIASYIRQTKGIEHFVFSSDRDLWALWKYAKFFDKADKRFNEKDYKNTFGKTPPKHVPLFKAVFGDVSDGIPQILGSDTQAAKYIIKVLAKIVKPNEFFDHLDEMPDSLAIKLTKKANRIKTLWKVAKLNTKSKIKIEVVRGDYKKMEEILLKKWECKSRLRYLSKLKEIS
jgi:5'-3' exonuclease